MKIGKFIFNRLLNKRQREIILQALVYSAHTYKRRGETEGYSRVSRVIGELSEKFGLKERTYTEKEVNEIIDKSSEVIAEKMQEVAKRAYKDGFKNGIKSVPIPVAIGVSRSGESLEPGMEFSKEKCESCEHKEECSLYALLKEEFDSDNEAKENEEKKEVIDTEEKEKEQV